MTRRREERTLATYAMTGVLRGTFEANAREDEALVAELAGAVAPELVAKAALVARAHRRSARLPAVLVAHLSTRDVIMMERVFDRVIDDGPSLRTFCEVIRNGGLGRRSFGSAPKRALRRWFASRTPEQIFRQSIGRSPSMSDVIKMVRPPPTDDQGEIDAAREALYGYLVGKNVDDSQLPALARAFEAFRRARGPVPDVPLEMLTALPLRAAHWTELASRMTFSELRAHLGTLLRHGVLADAEAAQRVADRLSDEGALARARALPFAIVRTLATVAGHVPSVVAAALARATELARKNVPGLPGGVTVHVDRSGSMLGPLGGARRVPADAMRCIDVAGVIEEAYRPYAVANADLEIVVSDDESRSMPAGSARRRVLVDVQPRPFAIRQEREDVLHVAGFSDEVFDTIARFARGELEGDRWLEVIEGATL